MKKEVEKEVEKVEGVIDVTAEAETLGQMYERKTTALRRIAAALERTAASLESVEAPTSLIPVRLEEMKTALDRIEEALLVVKIGRRIIPDPLENR